MKNLSKKEKDRMVKEVINNFDFQKVNKVMIALNWTWMGRRPKIHEMMKKATEYLYHVLDDDNCVSFGSGGFTAYRNDEEITLVFAVDSATAWFSEDKRVYRILKDF